MADLHQLHRSARSREGSVTTMGHRLADTSDDLLERMARDSRQSDAAQRAARLELERRARNPELSEVWCGRCDRPATEEIVTNLGTRSFCGLHAFAVSSSNFNGGWGRVAR